MSAHPILMLSGNALRLLNLSAQRFLSAQQFLRAKFELQFQSLFQAGKALAFPCDARGDVLLDALSAKAMENYLFARAVVGHEYANPVVLPCEV